MLRRLIERMTAKGNPSRSRTLFSGPRTLDMQIESLECRRMLTGTIEMNGTELLIRGGDADNTIVVSEHSTSFYVAADFLAKPRRFAKPATLTVRILGGDGDDTIVVTSTRRGVQVEGNAGNDRIFGGLGFDDIRGGSGDDILYGNNGGDSIVGGDGNDIIVGGDGIDTLDGGFGDDFIEGAGGDDILTGGGDNDTVFGGSGSDSVTGDAGNDRLGGGAGDDVIVGGLGDDVITGAGGADNIQGGGGNDRLMGGSGNDTLEGGEGDDTVVGGDGDDTVDGNDGDDLLFGDSGSDIITAGAGNDRAFAGSGSDIVQGNDGDDTIYGGIGIDLLMGHAGADELLGGDDRDILVGGTEVDAMNGQGGDDLLVADVISSPTDAPRLEGLLSDWTNAETYVDAVDVSLNNLDATFGDTDDRLNGGRGRDIFLKGDGMVNDSDSNEEVFGGLIAVEDTFSAPVGQEFTASAEDGVLANDIFSAGDDVTVSVVSSTNDTLVLNADGSFTFTQSFEGESSFIYEITNADGLVDLASATLSSGVPTLPAGATLTELDSGLLVFDNQVGSGAFPTMRDSVRIAYTGYLPNGDIFDENEEATFVLTDLIDGFAEGVEGMQVGGIRRIVIPPDLGYGENGNPPANIGPDDYITFDVQLFEINPS